MLFPTLDFALFFLAVFTVSWALVKLPGWRTGFLIGASYGFYAAWDWRFCLLLFGSSSGNWLFGRLISRTADPGRRRMLVATAVALNLSVLGFFKYFNFFLAAANAALERLGAERDLSYLDIVLPVGISFFTFHGISYVVDLYRGTLDRPATLPRMLLYIAFFPQLVAGPIVRAAHFLPQLAKPVDPRDIKVTRALLLILGGLFKKMVVANYLATDFVDKVFFDPSRHGAADLLLGAYGYAVQIYCDFSAYTDIAIGVAALLGYRFPKNFDQPYRAIGFSDFWRRWHISLSSWLRDYLYIPLGGNTGDWRRNSNLMVTMLLGGLWHGAAWNFVIWGGLHGLFLVAEHRLLGARKPAGWPLWGKLLGTVITFNLTCLAWIFFRSPDLGRAMSYLEGIGHAGPAGVTASPFVLTLLVGGLASQFLPSDLVSRLEHLMLRMPFAWQGALAGVCIVGIAAMGPSGVAPFIYFQF